MATTRALYQQAVTYQKKGSFYQTQRRLDMQTSDRKIRPTRKLSAPRSPGFWRTDPIPQTSLLNRKVIKDLLARPLGTTSSLPERAGLERARSISAWVKDYGVVLDL